MDLNALLDQALTGAGNVAQQIPGTAERSLAEILAIGQGAMEDAGGMAGRGMNYIGDMAGQGADMVDQGLADLLATGEGAMDGAAQYAVDAILDVVRQGSMPDPRAEFADRLMDNPDLMRNAISRWNTFPALAPQHWDSSRVNSLGTVLARQR